SWPNRPAYAKITHVKNIKFKNNEENKMPTDVEILGQLEKQIFPSKWFGRACHEFVKEYLVPQRIFGSMKMLYRKLLEKRDVV
ncbi:MAG: hypothetical protein ACYSX1_12455, partial [Planctomycetota bacterium]